MRVRAAWKSQPRDFSSGRSDFGQDGVERVAGGEELNDGAGRRVGRAGAFRLDEGAGGQGEQFVGTVADDDVVGAAIVDFCQFLAQWRGGRIGVEAEARVHSGADGAEDFWGRGIGVFVGVEFDQAPDLGLFAGDIGAETAHEGADAGWFFVAH